MSGFSVNSSYGLSQNTAKNVLDYAHPLIQFLLTPLGFVACALLVAVCAYGLQGRRGKEVLLFIAMLTGMVGYFHSKYWNNTLIPPLEIFRSLCKPFFVAAVTVLAARYATSVDSLRRSPLRPAAVAYALLLFLYNLRVLFVAPERAVAGSVMVVLLLVGLLQLFRKSISTGEDLAGILSVGVAAGLAFYALSGVQLLLGLRDSIVFSGRFCGLSANPQMAAEVTASLVPMANFLIISAFASRWQKVLGVAGLAVMLPFLVWSGSRTGVGMTLVALLVMNGALIRRWVALAAVGAVSWELYTHYFSRASEVAGRLISTANDRSAVWSTGWRVFVRHPLIGQAIVQSPVESSFISVAMGLGIVGIGLLVVLAFTEGRDILYVLSSKRILNLESRKICDFALALAAGFISGMFFDAYLVAVATTEAALACLVLAFTSLAYDLVLAQIPPVRAEIILSGELA